MTHHRQLADALLMIAPCDFCYNEQTAQDNEFQRQPTISAEQVQIRAMWEFREMVSRLREEGVEVLVVEKNTSLPKIPDAVFPNNWISTEHDGTILLYPMLTENRRLETRQFPDIEKLLIDKGYYIKDIVAIGCTAKEEALEGTGSLVIDHTNKVVYAALSERTHLQPLRSFVETRNYLRSVVFHASSSTAKPIYHTNIVMSIGEKFAVVCTECIEYTDEKTRVVAALSKTREVIEITRCQMEENFCGNILQLQSRQGMPLVVMSQNALRGFRDEQLARLQKHGKIVAVDIQTIEEIGGGSARCTMAEIFLPRR